MYESLLPRIKALPGVTSVATVNVVPFTGATAGWDGPFVADGTILVRHWCSISPLSGPSTSRRWAYGCAAAGRSTGTTVSGGAPVAIVSEQAARLLGVESGAVGRRIRLAVSPGEWRTIVGVAAETRYRAIREAAPTVYLPRRAVLRSHDTHHHSWWCELMVAPLLLSPSIRDAVVQTDPDVTVLHAAALSDLVSGQFTGPRLNAVLLSLFGAGAALLATVGLYSCSRQQSRRVVESLPSVRPLEPRLLAFGVWSFVKGFGSVGQGLRSG